MLILDPERIRIQNLQNKIGSGVNKIRLRTPPGLAPQLACVHWHALQFHCLMFWKSIPKTSQNTKFFSISCQCMLANCDANTIYALHRSLHAQKCSLSIRPHQASHCVMTFDAFLRIFCTASCNVVHLHLTFLFDHFKCLMLFTNLRFSSII